MFKHYQNTPNGGDFTFRFISDTKEHVVTVDSESGTGLYSLLFPCVDLSLLPSFCE